MEEIVLSKVVCDELTKKDGVLKRLLQKIRCKLFCCCKSSCSLNEEINEK